ncbi:class I SAM-dependent methyltransferase [Leptolyngbya sp. SLC-A1]|uniref:class I SAM-dependent methyltransferase n=1 Tax=unclassified Leptolyngbya TaxID=2650499 RepID=UPI00329A11FA
MSESLFSQRKQCPTCLSEKFSPLYECNFAAEPVRLYLEKAYGEAESFDIEKLKKTNYSLLQCQDCNLIFQEFIPSPALMLLLYENWIDAEKSLENRKRYGIAYYSLYSQDIAQILAYLGKPPADTKVLDFGMGWGHWALMSKAFGCEVYGAEISQRRIEYAKRNGISNIRWEDIPSEKFDFINTDQVFEHLADPQDTLKYLRKSLKPDSLIKISVPNSFGIRYRLKHMDWSAPKGSFKSLNPVAPLEHINCFYRQSILDLANSVDLVEIKIPISLQYKYTTVWDHPKRAIRNILIPIYRNILGLQNYYLFRPR